MGHDLIGTCLDFQQFLWPLSPTPIPNMLYLFPLPPPRSCIWDHFHSPLPLACFTSFPSPHLDPVPRYPPTENTCISETKQAQSDAWKWSFINLQTRQRSWMSLLNTLWWSKVNHMGFMWRGQLLNAKATSAGLCEYKVIKIKIILYNNTVGIQHPFVNLCVYLICMCSKKKLRKVISS